MARRTYTDKFRANAVVMLQAQGYPEKKGALTKVARHLGIAHPTLSRWYRAIQNPAPSNLVQEKIGDLTALLEDEIYAALGAMADRRDEAEYKELATALGIMFDKRQLLTGGPTDNQNTRIMIQYADTDANTTPTA